MNYGTSGGSLYSAFYASSSPFCSLCCKHKSINLLDGCSGQINWVSISRLRDPLPRPQESVMTWQQWLEEAKIVHAGLRRTNDGRTNGRFARPCLSAARHQQSPSYLTPAGRLWTIHRVRCQSFSPTAPLFLLRPARCCLRWHSCHMKRSSHPFSSCNSPASLLSSFSPNFCCTTILDNCKRSWTQQRTFTLGLFAFGYIYCWSVESSCKPWSSRTLFQDDISQPPGHSIRQVLSLLCLYTTAFLFCTTVECVQCWFILEAIRNDNVLLEH